LIAVEKKSGGLKGDVPLAQTADLPLVDKVYRELAGR